MNLNDVSFVVTDTETTGTRPDHHRIIEIGAVRVRNGQIVDRFQQLVNPGTAIPYQITRLTGITNSMVFGQPSVNEILDAYTDFLGDDVFVAHNVRFDRRFLNAELRRYGKPILSNKSLCTARLARRLLSGLRSKGLTSLADFYGIRIVNRHRAFDDAEATAKVLIRLLDKIRIQKEEPSLADVLLLQMKPYKSSRPQMPHIKKIKRELLGKIPERAGVYYMHDGAGNVIYIGKAKNLKARVRSYFNAIEAHPPKTRELLKNVRNVSWTETGNELAALLRESQLIKQIQPRYNRALKNYGRKPFIKLETNRSVPLVSSTLHLVDDGAEYYGPVRGGRYARFLIEMISRAYKLRECDDGTLAAGSPCMYYDIGRCIAPCIGDNKDAYSDEVNRVRKFLRGDDTTILDRLEEKMKLAASALEFEEARQYRDWIDRLRNLLAKQKEIAADVFSHNAAIVLPDDTSTQFHIFLVRFGRLARSMVIDPSKSDASTIVEDAVIDVFGSHSPPPGRFSKPDVDEVRIVASWLFVNRDSTSSILYQAHTTNAEFVSAIMSEMGSTIQEADTIGKTRTSTLSTQKV